MRYKSHMLGNGVYGLSEVALYTDLHTNRVRSWFTAKPYGMKSGRLFNGDYPIIENNYGVSFLDLIDVKVAAELRESGVTMPKLRAVYERLKDRLDTKHPFCHNNFYTDGREIIIMEAGAIGDETLIEVLSNQRLYVQSRAFLKHIECSDKTQLAERWNIAQGVVIDPAVSLGKPVIKDTGTTTYVVARSFKANAGNTDLVAYLFDLAEQQVNDAVSFEERHGCLRAA